MKLLIGGFYGILMKRSEKSDNMKKNKQEN